MVPHVATGRDRPCDSATRSRSGRPAQEAEDAAVGMNLKKLSSSVSKRRLDSRYNVITPLTNKSSHALTALTQTEATAVVMVHAQSVIGERFSTDGTSTILRFVHCVALFARDSVSGCATRLFATLVIPVFAICVAAPTIGTATFFARTLPPTTTPPVFIELSKRLYFLAPTALFHVGGPF